MRIYGTIRVLKLDPSAYSATLKKNLMTKFRKAAIAFLRAAVPNVPVDTGMARGSFLNLARVLRQSLTITPTNKYPQKYRQTGQDKSPELAQQYSTPADPDKIFKWRNNKLSFTYSTRVYHFNLHELAGNWHSFDDGEKAFIKVMRTLKVPKIKEFITRTTISFGQGHGLTKLSEEQLKPRVTYDR